MTPPPRKELTFHDVDGLAYAAERGLLDYSRARQEYAAHDLGPLLELHHLAECGVFQAGERWLHFGAAAPLVNAVGQNCHCWIDRRDEHAGLTRTGRLGDEAEAEFVGFLMAAKRAACDLAGLPKSIAGQLVAAIRELESNIHEHSNAVDTGLVAYKAWPRAFEFVVADYGIGVLRSLQQCEEFSSLNDEGVALRTALRDGVSRYRVDGRRGRGFRPIFTGLANLHCELRFRSGDHALTIDGTSRNLETAGISQKVRIDGFFVSVKCHAES